MALCGAACPASHRATNTHKHTMNKSTIVVGVIAVIALVLWGWAVLSPASPASVLVGNIPGNTVLERYEAEQEMQLEWAARGQQIANALGLIPPGGAPAGQPPPGAPAPGGGAPEGRPPSFNAPPSIQQKDGGSRSTIATSK